MSADSLKSYVTASVALKDVIVTAAWCQKACYSQLYGSYWVTLPTKLVYEGRHERWWHVEVVACMCGGSSSHTPIVVGRSGTNRVFVGNRRSNVTFSYFRWGANVVEWCNVYKRIVEDVDIMVTVTVRDSCSRINLATCSGAGRLVMLIRS
jgi:hypothetical protein